MSVINASVWEWLFFLVLSLATGWLGWCFLWGNARANNHKQTGSQPPNQFFAKSPFSWHWLELLLGPVVVFLVVCSLGLILAGETGFFRLRFILGWLGFIDLFLICLLFLKKSRRFFLAHYGGMDLWKRRDWILVLVLLAAFLLFNWPAEFILNYRDPGACANIAVWIAEKGSLKSINPDYAGFDDPDKQALFLPAPLQVAPYPRPYECFWILNPQSGMMTPNYFTLLPLWLALGYKLGGLAVLFRVNALFGLLSVMAIMALGRRLFHSDFIGWLAGALLAANLAQIWLSRSPFSEIMTQAFLLGGVWLWALAARSGAIRLFVFSGVTFGLTLFARPDSFLILAGFGLAIFIVAVLRKEWDQETQKSWKFFFLGFFPIAVWALIHQLIYSAFYLWTVIDALIKTTHRWEIISAAFVLAVICGGIWRWGKTIHGEMIADARQQQRWLFCLIFLFALLLLFNYFVRPYLTPSVYQPTESFYDKVSFKFHNELNLVRLGWYLTPLGLLLACLGFMIALPRLSKKEGRDLVMFFSLFITFGVFYLYKSRAMPDNYWVIRRYIEILIPGCLLLAGFCLSRLASFRWRVLPSGAQQLLVSVLIMGLVGWNFSLALKMAPLKEFARVVPQVEALAAQASSADILLMENNNFKNYLAGPLKFFFHKTVYIFAQREIDSSAFDRLMGQWSLQGKKVFLLTSEENSSLSSQKFQFQPFGQMLFQTEMLENPVDRLPRELARLTLPMQIYEIQPISQGSQPMFDLKLGRNFGVRTEGFYLAEQENNGTTFRWASGQALVQLPPFGASLTLRLSLMLSRPVPRGVALAASRIFLNGNLIQPVQPGSAPQVFRFMIPSNVLRSAGQANSLEIQTPTFCPSRLGIGPDVRELGVRVYSVRIESIPKGSGKLD